MRPLQPPSTPQDKPMALLLKQPESRRIGRTVLDTWPEVAGQELSPSGPGIEPLFLLGCPGTIDFEAEKRQAAKNYAGRNAFGVGHFFYVMPSESHRLICAPSNIQ